MPRRATRRKPSYEKALSSLSKRSFSRSHSCRNRWKNCFLKKLTVLPLKNGASLTPENKIPHCVSDKAVHGQRVSCYCKIEGYCTYESQLQSTGLICPSHGD